MRFRLFHVVWEMADGNGGVAEKNSNMSLAMKKYAHTFSIQILQGQNREDGHMSGTILCVYVGGWVGWGAFWVGVCVCLCALLHMRIRVCLYERPSLNGSVFSYPIVSLPCGYHSNINDLSPPCLQ